MIYPLIFSKTTNPLLNVNPLILKPPPKRPSSSSSRPFILCFHFKNPNTIDRKSTEPQAPFTQTAPSEVLYRKDNRKKSSSSSSSSYVERRSGSAFPKAGREQMLLLCGFGYWVQGFRCFPWLALNFHMAHNLHFPPGTLQLVQNSSNLPMVAKPLYGILSDAIYIAGAHRIPYVSIGVILQVLSWGTLALMPIAGEALPVLMACVLLSNLGASITEVAKDALIAEYGQRHNLTGLQSYTFMALAAGGILGNLVGGCFLLKTPPRIMFLTFAVLLSLQLVISSTISEESLGLPQPADRMRNTIVEGIRKQALDLVRALGEKNISCPLTWIVASLALVPILSGSMFCYQTQCLRLDPSVLGLSRVVSQLVLFSSTILYGRFWRKISMRKLITIVQIAYASSLLLDLVLVKRLHLRFGISDELYTLWCSGLSEAIAQFKLLPFSILFASLCPKGNEGSLTSFLASALCLSSIVSGFFGIGLAALLGITSGDYSSLPVGIWVQFVAALVPLLSILNVPDVECVGERERKRVLSKRTRRNRRVGRVVFGSVYAYRRERESEEQN